MCIQLSNHHTKNRFVVICVSLLNNFNNNSKIYRTLTSEVMKRISQTSVHRPTCIKGTFWSFSINDIPWLADYKNSVSHTRSQHPPPNELVEIMSDMVREVAKDVEATQQ